MPAGPSRRSRFAMLALAAFCAASAITACSAITSFDGLVASDAKDSGAGDATNGGDAPPLDASATDAAPDVGSSKYAAAVLALSPVAYFRLDETGGSVAHDISPSQLSATYGSLVKQGQPGLLSSDSDLAAVFPGLNDAGAKAIITMPRASVLEPTSELTVEAWINLAVSSSTIDEIVSYGDTTDDPFQPWVLQLDNGNAEFFTSGTGFVRGATVLTSSSTYFLAATYSVSASALCVYVNGTLDTTPCASTSFPLANYDFDEGLGIGGGGHDDLPVKGTVDEVAVYNYALSATQIMAHFNAGSSAAK